METKLIQIETVSAEEFKTEIVNAILEQLKPLLQKEKIEDNKKEMITRTEAADLLNISLVKLWEITKNNLIPKYKIGGKVLHKKIDVQRFINESFKS
ncbi:helix-turn-helix domain-containing protein [Flavobacterium cheniae]|uniref:Excisionase family DNA binding protein n=1 Tax=Flavobacterium cheniae TaxID=295428 RepID=A0A562KBW2_9FLAO|nr:helix-turn-helix domain-containing protein [Flavobacterium cheniae]TDR18621.1 excisionase family DNA binding protein [Flavobacterium cheniae]TWH92897.1 excisionase family DNA binding protein [Flavobacterium cheniae]